MAVKFGVIFIADNYTIYLITATSYKFKEQGN